jgi:short-subunit dehydrogenase
MSKSSVETYGSWAVVAGASEGLGAAFAQALARRGHNLILIARRAEVLEAEADRLRKTGVEVRTLSLDLGNPDFVAKLLAELEGRELGVAVFNAAYSYMAPFLSRPVSEPLKVAAVNVQGPLLFAHALLPQMVERKRGALILMSSLSGFQGSPFLAAYSASKAFNTTLAEALWGEMEEHGVHVLASAAGAIRTPGYAATLAKEAPGTMDPDAVAEETLRALGKGPLVVPGTFNKFASVILRRLLPRSLVVRIMRNSIAGLQ